ncbi:MAG: phosphoribosyltransferase [Candidatus Methanomethylicia archaeon]
MIKHLKLVAPSWDELFVDTIRLAEMIESSGFKPDVIVAIARGGWIIGRLLSDFMAQPNITDIRVEFYKDIYATEPKPRITQSIGTDIKGLKVLVADDVADTGESLIITVEYLKSLGAEDVKVATIYVKPWSKIRPDYYVKKTDAWIIFPHEVRETIDKLYLKWASEGKTIDWMLKTLVDSGMKREYAEYFLKKASRSDENYTVA